MTFIEPVRTGFLATVNPVAKLIAAFIVALALLSTIDWVSGSVALLAELLLLIAGGLPIAIALRRVWPILAAVPFIMLTTALYGQSSGRVHWQWAFIEVSDGSISLAIATGLRVLAIAVPSVLLFITIDPTDLADGLAQVLRLPARFVLGGLAGLRLVGLFADDWRALSLARRARGVADTGRLRRVLGQAFALFVLSLRRGAVLATAMEARGLGAPVARSWARPSRLRSRDWVVMGLGAAVAAVALASAALSGNWHFIAG